MRPRHRAGMQAALVAVLAALHVTVSAADAKGGQRQGQAPEDFDSLDGGSSAKVATGHVITSRQMIGTDYNSQRNCNSEVMRGLNGKLYSDFRVSGHGAVWETSTAILSIDMQSQFFDPVDAKSPLGLRLSLGFMPNKQKSSIHAVKVGTQAQRSLSAPKSDSAHCGILKPGCYGGRHCYTMKPPFGWSPLTSVKQPSATVLDMNITALVDSDDITVQLWAVPDQVTEHARWETPTFTILNWRFFNFDSAESSGSSDGDNIGGTEGGSSGEEDYGGADESGGFSGSDEEDYGGADEEPARDSGPASPDADADEGADEGPAEGGGGSDWFDLGAPP